MWRHIFFSFYFLFFLFPYMVLIKFARVRLFTSGNLPSHEGKQVVLLGFLSNLWLSSFGPSFCGFNVCVQERKGLFFFVRSLCVSPSYYLDFILHNISRRCLNHRRFPETLFPRSILNRFNHIHTLDPRMYVFYSDPVCVCGWWLQCYEKSLPWFRSHLCAKHK